MVFPVVMYGCQNWTIKNVPKNWCFWTVVLEKTLESPLECKEIGPVNPKGNQPWIFIGSTDAKAEAPTLGQLMWRANSEKTLMLGKTVGKRRKGQQRMRWLGRITNSMDINLIKLQEIVEDRGAWRAVVHGIAKSQTWLSNWKASKNLKRCVVDQTFRYSWTHQENHTLHF